MDKTNLRFDWVGETKIAKHWDDLNKSELLLYIEWLECKLVKNCYTPDFADRSEQLPCGDLVKHNFSISKIGRCIPCDRSEVKAN